MLKTTKKLARAGIVGALYVALSMVAFPVASGFIQFRVGEALTILPLLFPETAVGLFIGCALTGLITACPVIDIVFGSLVTLLSGVLTAVIGKKVKKVGLKFFFGGLFPVILNAVFLPLIWYWCYGKLEMVYLLQSVSLLISQSVAVYGVGAIVYFSIKKINEKKPFN